MKICIIDDDPVCHFIAEKLLGKMMTDFDLLHFYHGLEAFEFFQRQPLCQRNLPEIILLDINMPVADGWTFLEMFKSLSIAEYNPQIFICSSSDNTYDLLKAASYVSIGGYIHKPLDLGKLKTILR